MASLSQLSAAAWMISTVALNNNGIVVNSFIVSPSFTNVQHCHLKQTHGPMVNTVPPVSRTTPNTQRSAKPDPSTESNSNEPQPLETSGEWSAFFDETNTGLVYYFNMRTGESVWEPPTRDFPEVVLSREVRKNSRKIQREYRRRIREEKRANGIAEPDFLGGLFGGTPEPKVVVPVTPEPEPVEVKQPGFFDSIFGGGTAEPKEASSAKPVVAQTEPLIEKEKSQPSPSFDLGSLFGGSGSAPPNDVEEGETLNINNINNIQSVEEEEIEVASSAPSFGLGNMFKGSSKEEDEEEDEDEEQDAGESLNLADFGKTVASEEAPKQKSGKSKTPAFSNPFSPKAPAGPPLTLDTSSLVLPHPEKVQWGGEDAIFVKERTFGVFDGVSGAEKLDGVPLYSKTMSEQMDIMVDDELDMEEGLTMKQLEKTMLEAAEYADGEATGATTGIVASVGKDNVLRALNVGDSALLVIRDSKILSRSKDIVHYFDCPYQLAFDSPDRPRDGTKLTVNLQSQDLILMATDGIFDNLSDDLVLEVCDENAASTNALVQRIVDESRRISLDDEAPTPYAKQAKNAKYEGFEDGLGGKVDDISCIAIRCT